VNGSPAPGVSSGSALAAMARVSEATLRPATLMSGTGTASRSSRLPARRESFLALAVLFAYLFLVALYESWMIPIPVLLSVGSACLGHTSASRSPD